MTATPSNATYLTATIIYNKLPQINRLSLSQKSSNNNNTTTTAP